MAAGAAGALLWSGSETFLVDAGSGSLKLVRRRLFLCRSETLDSAFARLVDRHRVTRGPEDWHVVATRTWGVGRLVNPRRQSTRYAIGVAACKAFVLDAEMGLVPQDRAPEYLQVMLKHLQTAQFREMERLVSELGRQDSPGLGVNGLGVNPRLPASH
jgi:hypothetical protein